MQQIQSIRRVSAPQAAGAGHTSEASGKVEPPRMVNPKDGEPQSTLSGWLNMCLNLFIIDGSMIV